MSSIIVNARGAKAVPLFLVTQRLLAYLLQQRRECTSKFSTGDTGRFDLFLELVKLFPGAVGFAIPAACLEVDLDDDQSSDHSEHCQKNSCVGARPML